MIRSLAAADARVAKYAQPELLPKPGVASRDARFGRGGTVSFESLRSELKNKIVRNH